MNLLTEDKITTPEEPKGVGSIIRVVFKDPDVCGPETFYVGVSHGLWVEYDSDTGDEFTWEQVSQVVKFDEAEVFEVVYEGFGTTGTGASRQHHKDWIWQEGL